MPGTTPGCVATTADFLQALPALCDKYDILGKLLRETVSPRLLVGDIRGGSLAGLLNVF